LALGGGDYIVKITLEQTMKAQRGSTLLQHSFFNLGTRCGWVVNGIPWLLYPSKETWNPFYRTQGGPQGQSREAGKISPLLEFQPQTIQAIASCYNNCATTILILNKNVCMWDKSLCSSVAEDWGLVGRAAVLLGWTVNEIQSLHLQDTAV